MKREVYILEDLKLVEKNGLIELSGDLPVSKWSNGDLAPVPIDKRTWGTYAMTALWAGIVICITSWMMAGSMISAGMNVAQSILILGLGQVIMFAALVGNAYAGTKYGISSPVYMRSAFGMKGTNFPGILRALIGFGWFGIQNWVAGSALSMAIGLIFPKWAIWDAATAINKGFWVAGLSSGKFICMLIVTGFSLAIAYSDSEGIRKFAQVSVPIMIGIGLSLFIWTASKVGIHAMWSGEGLSSREFLNKSPLFLTGMAGYWLAMSVSIPDFSRFAKSQRAQLTGQFLGVVVIMTAFALMGVMVSQGSISIFGRAVWDLVELAGLIGARSGTGGTLLIISSFLFVTMATLSTNVAANMIAPLNVFINLLPKRLNMKNASIIFCIVSFIIGPWWIMSSHEYFISNWLNAIGGALGGVIGIQIVDFWYFKKAELNLIELYKEKGIYWYQNGYNKSSILALMIAMVIVLPSQFIESMHIIQSYAIFVSFAIAGGLYFILEKKRGADKVLTSTEKVKMSD